MKKLLYSILFTSIISMIFITYPGIDIEFSKLFFSESKHKFYFANNFILKFIANSAYFLAFLLLAYNSILILLTFIKTKSFNYKSYKSQIIVLLVFFIGSLMIVQVYSKHHFGRARPANVREFNGDLTFSPAFKVSKQCKSNCSFVSFHTSIGMLFLIYSLEQIGKRRRFMILGTSIFTVTLGLIRIIQGKHFLSDVIISACFMIITYYFILVLFEACSGKNYKLSIYNTDID
ncbi:phosphatase PAP2 family protein [Candidatus Bandiella numerosa]|uniref:phosphatase PAP2 family protein n=1 Tax=Candidatus Bandiella numerosa TaxID=2570586 RepID=UPI001F3C007D|nr:phosphatase PAP2 family protein [Candidatus Bandiella numerosa]